MKGTKPAYPTLLELIRGRVKRTAIAGGSAAVIATVGCGSGGDGGGPSYDLYPGLDVGNLLDQETSKAEDTGIKDLPLDMETLVLGGKDIHYHLDLDHPQSEDTQDIAPDTKDGEE